MKTRAGLLLIAGAVLAGAAFGQAPQGAVRITLEEAIQMALRHNHSLQAARTTVYQNKAQEVTANLRPNPDFSTVWAYLPLYKPEEGFLTYLHDSTELDVGLSYTIERGQKRQHRLQAARDATAVTRSQVIDNERSLEFQVASLFINVQLAESTIEVTGENLKSFQHTVEISETQYKSGRLSENDYLKIKLQLLQFQTDVQQAQLARVQALSDLRQQVGYEEVPADYDVSGKFDYNPLLVSLPELEAAALQNRPDLQVAERGIAAANSQYGLAKANGKPDLTIGGNYSHTSGVNAATVSMSIPLAIFDRNQGEIARTHYVITQAQEQEKSVKGQVLTDVRDAYEGLRSNDKVVQFYRSGNLETSQRNREISEYAYQRGAISLLDFLDTERSYRATQLAYRQAIGAYLTALEQLRQAVGTRSLP
ncbi:MAG: TolC family protein [Acidobacteriia bacterium]|nr:TolC family protein [Terriglobia bacterium]